MNINIKNTITGLILCSLIMITGCGTTLAYQHNKKAAIRDYVYSSGDEQMVQAYSNGDVRGIGINISAADAIFRSPGAFFVQLAGVGVDVLTAWGAYEVYDDLNGSSDSSSSSQTSGRDSTSVTIRGQGNTVQIRGDQTTYGSPTTAGE